MKAKALNPQVILEFFCYAVFGGILFYLASSGKYLSYVTPRMKPYLYFTAIVMMVWACVELTRLFRPQHKIRAFHCFILIIPFLLIILPHSQLSTATLSTGYAGGGALYQNMLDKSAANGTGTTEPAVAESETPVSDNQQSGAPTSDSADASTSEQSPSQKPLLSGLSGLDAENKKITVSNDDFYLWISEIYMNMDQYEGYTISITGFVFNDPEYLATDEFVAARLAMVCCVADLTPIGILCSYDQASDLTANTWVTVEGVIYKGQDDGQDVPKIAVSDIAPAEEVEGYIYPY